MTSFTATNEHVRPRLPHLSSGAIPQTVTFRLADSVPLELIRRWQEELASAEPDARAIGMRRRFDDVLDRGEGNCLLREPRVAAVVEDTLRHFDGVRYRLHAWVVMPNHVHALLTPSPGHRLAAIVQGWKGFSAKEANALLGRTGTFWQADYFDRVIRDEQHFRTAVTYIELNPVKGHLCAEPEDWRFGSARTKGTMTRALQRGWTPRAAH